MASRTTLILKRSRSEPQRTQLRFPAIAGFALLFGLSRAVLAQQPTPLFSTPPASPSAQPSPDQTAPAGQPLPPLASPSVGGPSSPPVAAIPPAASSRVFCEQSVSAQPANPAAIPERYRPYIGIFSDADWNPQTCAALIVENIADDGTATITYVFGPLASGGKASGGVLHGTGIVKDGALLFQNADGSQYAFRPFYSDLDGKWTTPKGQTYEAIFKRSY